MRIATALRAIGAVHRAARPAPPPGGTDRAILQLRAGASGALAHLTWHRHAGCGAVRVSRRTRRRGPRSAPMTMITEPLTGSTE